MWQRIQTIFLLISAIVGIAFLFLPLAELENEALYAKDDMATTSIDIAIILLTLFTIFNFKNRKLQMRLCIVNIFLSVALLISAIMAATGELTEYLHFEFAAGIPAVIIIAQFLARRNIKKDEDLVKSMDRFR